MQYELDKKKNRLKFSGTKVQRKFIEGLKIKVDICYGT